MRLSNKPMKRLSLYLFLILFTLQTPSLADDIRDFQIEGMSIGDSLLDYFSEEEIKNNRASYYTSNKFTPVEFHNTSFLKTYDSFSFSYKTKDKNYKIYRMSGIINYNEKSIKDCYKKMDEIIAEVSELFQDITTQSEKNTTKFYEIDKTGKSTTTGVLFTFSNNDAIDIRCYDFSEETDYWDNVGIELKTSEFRNFLTDEAYK